LVRRYVFALNPVNNPIALTVLAFYHCLQNLAGRKYLERRKAKKLAAAQEEKEKLEEVAAAASEYGYGNAAPDTSADHDDMEDESESKSEPLKIEKTSSSGWFGKSKKKSEDTVADDLLNNFEFERPSFKSDLRDKGSGRRLAPRSVAVPYSRFRKDRFYDWPPDPTVSRATPVAAIVGERKVFGRPEEEAAAAETGLPVASFETGPVRVRQRRMGAATGMSENERGYSGGYLSTEEMSASSEIDDILVPPPPPARSRMRRAGSQQQQLAATERQRQGFQMIDGRPMI
jgi:hypothetical protein